MPIIVRLTQALDGSIRLIYLAPIALALSAVPAEAISAPVTISDFRFGLACATPKASRPDGWICQPTDRVLVTDQSKCKFNEKIENCTWTGFEFDYVATEAGAKISCMQHSSKATLPGSPAGISGPESDSQSYELTLPDRSGHLFNAQYFVLAYQKSERDDLVVSTTCTSAGRRVIDFQYSVHFPVVPKV